MRPIATKRIVWSLCLSVGSAGSRNHGAPQGKWHLWGDILEHARSIYSKWLARWQQVAMRPARLHSCRGNLSTGGCRALRTALANSKHPQVGLLTGMYENWPGVVLGGRRCAAAWRASCRGSAGAPGWSSWTRPHTSSSRRRSWPARRDLTQETAALTSRHHMTTTTTMMTSLRYFRTTSSMSTRDNENLYFTRMNISGGKTNGIIN